MDFIVKLVERRQVRGSKKNKKSLKTNENLRTFGRAKKKTVSKKESEDQDKTNKDQKKKLVKSRETLEK